MPQNSLSPLSVVPYGRDYIIDFVRYITGWNERSEVTDKAQLHYLYKYLEVDHVACKTIVVESDYIDRHFLEDYSEYYARCFPSHPRRCSRLHFFSTEFSETEFKGALKRRSETFETKLQRHYIGFVVIRPIPHTVFARVCLRPYEALASSPRHRILRKRVNVSLFGFNLVVRTIPFIEQDKVVSACATSAIWTALSASPDMSAAALPSPSNITKSAAHAVLDGTRTFPTNGLTGPQIARSLKHFGLEPTIFWEDRKGALEDLKAHIYSYISNDSPVVLGGAIYEKHGESYRYLGHHLVCVVGYGMGQPAPGATVGLQAYSDRMEKIYIHDDRYGPYVRLSLSPTFFEIDDARLGGFEMSVHDLLSNLFVPDIAIVGLYHKIRIPYTHVYDACEALFKYLYNTVKDFAEANESGVAGARDILDGCWDISLMTSKEIKEDIIDSASFICFNGLLEKTSLLLQNMPRYVWRCRIFKGNIPSEDVYSDILFDATEVPQGKILVGWVAYSISSHAAWTLMERCVQERSWQSYNTGDARAKEAISCFFKFFGEERNNAYLNASYGPLGLPRRSLKQGETDLVQNIAQRQDTRTIRRGNHVRDWAFLDKKKKYIWVINEVGDIVIGEDIADADGFKGHPTLIDGRPGRVAGELFYRAGKRSWGLNLKSRAYSGHLDWTSTDADYYVNHVISNNLSGLAVQKA